MSGWALVKDGSVVESVEDRPASVVWTDRDGEEWTTQIPADGNLDDDTLRLLKREGWTEVEDAEPHVDAGDGQLRAMRASDSDTELEVGGYDLQVHKSGKVRRVPIMRPPTEPGINEPPDWQTQLTEQIAHLNEMFLSIRDRLDEGLLALERTANDRKALEDLRAELSQLAHEVVATNVENRKMLDIVSRRQPKPKKAGE